MRLLLFMSCLGFCVALANDLSKSYKDCLNKDFDACEVLYKSGTQSVESCDKDSCNALGIYLRDTGRDANSKALALAYLEKSLNLGNDLAYRDLGIYYRDLGDLKKAKSYYEIGCQKGVYWACYSLGLIYGSKEGDFKNAIKYYSIACDKGKNHQKSFACANMGHLYMEDRFDKNGQKQIAQDLQKALKYSEMACKMQDTIACTNVAKIYESGGKGVKQNAKLAKSYYQKICDIGDERAMEVIDACQKAKY